MKSNYSKNKILCKIIASVLACTFMINSACAVTDIVTAIESGNIADLQIALARPDLDIELTYGRDKRTALHYAVLSGNREIVDLVLERGAKIEAQDILRRTPLHMAARSGNREIVELLLDKGANIESSDLELKTPLHNAIISGGPEVVELLLERGADFRKTSIYGQKTLLHIAAELDKSKEIELLLGRHASIDARDLFGHTPLRGAIVSGKIESIRILLAAEDRKFEADKDSTLLHHALLTSRSGDPTEKDRKIKVVELLLNRDRKTDFIDPVLDLSPLHLAAERDSEIMKLLLEKGIGDINVPTKKDQETPLHWAVRSENLKVVEVLVSHGAGKEIPDIRGRMPIHLAVGPGLPRHFYLPISPISPDITSGAIARLVVPHGCDFRDAEGNTPLHLAISSYNVPAMEAIIYAGADYNLREIGR